MSLVLEALKKLEREKGRDEHGFVVMAATPWPTRAARRWPVWATAGVAFATVVALAVWRVMPRPPATAPGAAPAAAVPAVAAPAVVAPPADSRPAWPPRVPVEHRAAGGSPVAGRPTPVPAPAAAVDPAGQPIPPRTAPAPSPGSQPELRLQAISERDGQPVAMVNDRLVRVGDEFDGVRVIAIRTDEIDVEIRGRLTTLRF